MSSDAKQKEIKTKSRSNQIPSKNSGTTPTTGISKTSEKSSNSTFSLLDKLDINNLKKSTFKYVKSSPQTKQDASSAVARKACIDYALEMVISNLVVSGQLDPTKAHQMRTPSMKGQIASMCDKILERRAVKVASSKKLAEAKKLLKPPPTTRSPSRSNAKSKGGVVQKWAVQPAALPITIITDKDLSKFATVGGEKEKKSEVTGKKHGVLEFKSYDSSTSIQETKHLRMKKQKAASVSIADTTTQQKPTKQLPIGSPSGIAKNVESGNQNRENREEQPEQRLYQASSEVPSDFSIESNVRLLSGHSLSERIGPGPKAPAPPRSVQFERQEAEYNKLRSSAPLSTIPSNDTTNTEPVQHGAVEASNANESASCPGTAKTLNSIINSNSSISTVTKDFQMVVDMKGFQNDEIAMEVEARKLIFLAARPKRSDMNMRKVTEVVDVPPGVKMENLKIGRRKDGFVVIEEHEAEHQGF